MSDENEKMHTFMHTCSECSKHWAHVWPSRSRLKSTTLVDGVYCVGDLSEIPPEILLQAYKEHLCCRDGQKYPQTAAKLDPRKREPDIFKSARKAPQKPVLAVRREALKLRGVQRRRPVLEEEVRTEKGSKFRSKEHTEPEVLEAEEQEVVEEHEEEVMKTLWKERQREHKLRGAGAGGAGAGGKDATGGPGAGGEGGTAGAAPAPAPAGAGAQVEDLVAPVTSESAVKVAVVVRPPMNHEKGCADIINVLPPNRINLLKEPPAGEEANPDVLHSFEFDRVIRVDSAAASKQVFELVRPLIRSFCQGINATVFAYGQTGSGKTYTMGTSSSSKGSTSSEPRGVAPLTFEALFSYINAKAETHVIIVTMQFTEVYKEKEVDLLAGGRSAAATPFKSKPSASHYSKLRGRRAGATKVTVSSWEEAVRVLNQGSANRSVASHKMNSESSRSHAIVTLHLEQKANSLSEELHFLRSKLHLVDLAGSERAEDTGATGERFSQGVFINKSLSVLGRVTKLLAEGKQGDHVPYRDSKLTHLLEDSLGGNSETLFLVCVSPVDYEQTWNTLRYASDARNIKNSPRQNNKMSPREEVGFLRGQVQQLLQQLQQSNELKAQLEEENNELKTQLEGRAGAGGPVVTV